MIIVLEGPDGSGKTTVAAHIQALHPSMTRLLKCGPPSDDVEPMDQYCDVIYEAARLHKDGLTVAIDRLHVGELVYGPIMRGASRLTLGQARQLDRRLDDLGAVRAVMTLPTSELWARQLARDGGAPDAKSGAGREHLRPIRAVYDWLLGGQYPALPGWTDAGAGRYPEVIARDLLARG